MGVGALVSLGGAGFAVLIATLTNNPIWKIVKDPADVERFPSYIGMLSNWSILLWTASASVCLFSAAVLSQQKAPGAIVKFFAMSGCFSLILGIDDLYLLHDHLLPHLLNIPEMFFYLLYFFTFAAYLIYFAPQIVKQEYLLFLAALVFFSLSRRSLIILPFFDKFMTTVDMLKYFGIVFWLAFFYRSALHELGAAFNREESGAK